MLSFLKEQEQSNNPVQAGAHKNQHAENIKTMQEQEYLTVDNKKRSANKTTYLLAIAFIAGLVCLVFMIKKSTPKKASAQNSDQTQTKIATAIAKITGINSQFLSKMDGIVNKFYELSNIQQVKVKNLSKNPFDRDTFLNNLEINADKQPEVDTEFLRKQQIKQQAKELHLLSIIQSIQGISCMINDEILYEGDTIQGFKVTAINKNSVTLVWDKNPSQNTNIILKLDE